MKIGIISDIHEDILSLSLALRMLEKERCDRVVSLGDIVGFDNGYYGAGRVQDAEACIRLVKESCSISLAGNHDLFAIKKLPEFTDHFVYPKGWYSIPLEERWKIGKNKLWDYSPAEDQIRLSDVSREYLSGLPEFLTEDIDGFRIMFSHHLYPDLSGSLRRMPSWPPDIWPHLVWMRRNGCHNAVSGHVHIKNTLRGTWFQLTSRTGDRISLTGCRTWISCPPVTLGGVPSGLMVLDTGTGIVSTRFISK